MKTVDSFKGVASIVKVLISGLSGLGKIAQCGGCLFMMQFFVVEKQGKLLVGYIF